MSPRKHRPNGSKIRREAHRRHLAARAVFYLQGQARPNAPGERYARNEPERLPSYRPRSRVSARSPWRCLFDEYTCHAHTVSPSLRRGPRQRATDFLPARYPISGDRDAFDRLLPPIPTESLLLHPRSRLPRSFSSTEALAVSRRTGRLFTTPRAAGRSRWIGAGFSPARDPITRPTPRASCHPPTTPPRHFRSGFFDAVVVRRIEVDIGVAP